MKDEAAKKRYLDSVNASRVKRMQMGCGYEPAEAAVSGA